METPCARTGRPQQRPSRFRERAGWKGRRGSLRYSTM
jgi:hypothetical protein